MQPPSFLNLGYPSATPLNFAEFGAPRGVWVDIECSERR